MRIRQEILPTLGKMFLADARLTRNIILWVGIIAGLRQLPFVAGWFAGVLLAGGVGMILAHAVLRHPR